jgi:hypothetical protein
MSGTSASPASTPLLSTDFAQLSAEELHEILLKSFALGNRSHLRFILALLALEETRQYLLLGYSSIRQYAERNFGLGHTQTSELLRVARKLEALPLSRSSFSDGKVSFSALKALTRIASPATEKAWLEFAAECSVRRLELEVADALEKGRELPRDKDAGLPRTKLRMMLELEPEEYAIVQQALRKAMAEISERAGGGRVTHREAFVYLAQRILETDPEGKIAGRSERDQSIYTVVYTSCPTCRAARLLGPEGPIEVAPETLDRIAEAAEEVRIAPEEEAPPEEASLEPESSRESSGPNTTALRRRVLLREGHRCANPGCRNRLGLQCHHLRLRSEGGETALSNETALCARCHSGIHAGHLGVERDARGELRFIPHAETLRIELEKDVAELRSIPLCRIDVPPASVFTRVNGGAPGGAPAPSLDGLISALERLGFPRKEARLRLEGARGKLRERLGREPREEDLLREALSRSSSPAMS